MGRQERETWQGTPLDEVPEREKGTLVKFP